MAYVYNGADIFCMASKMESFGLVYAEALACGIPVIGTSVGGIPEIIDNGKTGYLTEPNNHVELAKRIEFLLHNKDKIKLMGERGRKTMEKRFGLKNTSDNLIGIFNSTLDKNSPILKSIKIKHNHLNVIDQITSVIDGPIKLINKKISNY